MTFPPAISPRDEVAWVERAKLQRNLFAVLALSFLVSIGFALPRRVANFRASKSVNAQLLELQTSIEETQNRTRAVQTQITALQQEIKLMTAK
jgi:septal ring factor EnvC (AmiA/AmiB activator)